MQETVANVLGNAMSLAHGDVAVNRDRERRLERMADPAQTHLGHVLDTADRPRLRLQLVDELGIGRIHEAAEHLGGRLAEHEEDRDRDQQAHDGSASG